MNKLFMIIPYISIFLIHKIKNQDDNCIINDSIIRTQILNKIIMFGGIEIASFTAIEMNNKDIFFLCVNTLNWGYGDNYLYIWFKIIRGNIFQ